MKGKYGHKLLTRVFFHLLPHQIVLLILTALTGIVDTLFAAGFTGVEGMSAIGFYSPINHFLYALSITLVSGSQLLVGESFGRNEEKRVNEYYSTDLILSFVLSVLMAVLLVLSAVFGVADFFMEDPVERTAANRYILGQAVGIPALVLGQQMFSFLSLRNQTKRTTAASIACVVVNILADWLLAGVCHLGTLGLGLGTAMGMWAFFLILIQYDLTGRSETTFSIKLYSMNDAKTIILRGYPGAINRFAEMIRTFIVNILILRFVGYAGLSVFAAVNSVMILFWPVPYAMSSVSRMIMGVCLGEEDRQSLSILNRVVFGKGMLLTGCVAAVIMALSGQLAGLFFDISTEYELFRMTQMGFIIIPPSMLTAVCFLHFSCYGQAIRDKYLSVFVPLMDGLFVFVVYAVFLIPSLGMNGLYLCNIFDGLTDGLLIFGYIIFRLKRFPKSFEDMLILPDGFGASADERLEISIRDKAELREMSIGIIDFAIQKGIDRKRAVYSGLAMEEMVGNVLMHGFEEDRKDQFLEVRVIHKEGDMILAVRDNCRAFNPLQRVNILDEDDLISNVGIRLVVKIAKRVDYRNVLGINALTMRV